MSKIMNICDIIKVTHNAIRYLDNEDNEQKINLFECSKNWVDYFNGRGDFITWEGNPAPNIMIESNTCVGKRDWFAEKPYIELFSNPKIRFEIRPQKRFIDFINKNWKHRYYKEFHKLCTDLQEVGWSTFDLG